MQIGIDTFVERVVTPDDPLARNSAERVAQLLEEAELADRVGLDIYAIGEHHREEYVASAPAILLAAIAARTKNIRVASAVTVLSSDDPVRVFQQFATVDLISNGRAEIIVGRGSFVESYPLFGYDTKFYDELFAEKLDLLLALRDDVHVHWEGHHRASLTGQGAWPRPVQNPLPIRLGVGGTPASFARAGALGLPLTVAIIGGEPHRFRPLIDLYYQAAERAGHAPRGQAGSTLDVALHCIGYLADTDDQAADELWPAYQHTFSRIGRERGWGPTSRAAFDAQRGPTGAFLVGSPATVAAKIKRFSTDLGGISHDKVLRSIELMGTQLKPLL
jgi:probable LLM family oxidoreductase